MEEHTPDNLSAAIDHAVSHDTEFHQFMLYTPLPGTPLFAEHKAGGTLLDPECNDVADTHGQLRFNFRHPYIPMGMETQFLLRAFARDLAVNGPSVVRMARTLLLGWLRYRRHPDRRVRARFKFECRWLAITYAGGVWAARKWFKSDAALYRRIDGVLKDIYRVFGPKARLAAPLVGRFLHHRLLREDRRLRQGWTCEPPTCYESNVPGRMTHRPTMPSMTGH
jgi:hypothetical protein